MIKNKQAEMIKNLSDEVLLMNAFITQGLVLVVALILGLFLFDDLFEFFKMPPPNGQVSEL